MMKNARILARREMAMLFNAPATYVVLVTFLLILGWLFSTPLFVVNLSVMDSFVGPMPLLLSFVMPAFTMRSFAEEFRTGTIEPLATLPITDTEIVIGKYIGTLGMIGALLGFMLIYPIILFAIGSPDLGQALGSYMAIFCLAAFFGAIGLWASSLTRNQVVSFIIGFFVCFLFFMLSHVADFMPGALSPFVRAWGVQTHFEAMARGVFDTRDLLYWLSGVAFFLTACLGAVHARRWR